MQLTWLGAAGFRGQTSEGAIFLIDPFLSRPKGATPPSPIQLSDLFPIDEIFLTQGRFDHASDTPALVEQSGAIVHAPGPVKEHLASLGVSTHSLQTVTLKRTNQVGHLRWQALAGRVSQSGLSPTVLAAIRNRQTMTQIRDLDRQWPLGGVVNYFFETGALSLIHFGSAGWDEDAVGQLRPDVALLPVENTPLLESYVIRLAAQLQPRLVIPHHWDNYHPAVSRPVDLTNFADLVQSESPRTRVYQPTLGQPFDLIDLL